MVETCLICQLRETYEDEMYGKALRFFSTTTACSELSSFNFHLLNSIYDCKVPSFVCVVTDGQLPESSRDMCTTWFVLGNPGYFIIRRRVRAFCAGSVLCPVK